MVALDRVATDRDWLPVGQEPHPVGNITQYSVLRNDGISILSRPDGEIDAEAHQATGVYYHDTRFVSRLVLSFGGVKPILLDAHATEDGLSAIFTNPAIRSPDSDRVVPAQSLVLRRRRVLTEALLESLTVSNYGREAVQVDIRVEFDADFCDIFVVRGFQRTSPVPFVHADTSANEVCFRYRGVDGVERRARFTFITPPEALAPNEAVFLIDLEPGATSSIELEVEAQRQPSEHDVVSAERRLRHSHQEWLNALTTVRTDHDALNAVLQRSLLDLAALRTHEDEHEYLAAGVPWYDAPFGRDTLITGIELLAFTPSVLRNALLLLSCYQARRTDVAHDAEPGKIPHELRWGELANAGEVPFGCYYGSVDSTPLFLYSAAEYHRWTGDIATIQQLWPSIEAAYGWCVRAQESGVDGFLSYARESAAGLENQGWKDSHDAIVWPDGRLVEPPIALVEVQAYLIAACLGVAELARRMSSPLADDAARRADLLRQRFHERYSHPELGFVLCLDGQGRPVPTPASNAGHALWTGVAEAEQARLVAGRLLQKDLFSGWGVRTLSSRVGGFNPLGYHVGTVWPHDNALVLDGFRRYALDERAEQLGTALFQMAQGFPDYRVPELFSGDDRELRQVPTPYPVASRPQAWSAASIPFVLISMLGIRPGPQGRMRIVRPMLPIGMGWVQLRNVQMGQGAADLTFRRTGRHISVEVENIRGGLEVVLSEA